MSYNHRRNFARNLLFWEYTDKNNFLRNLSHCLLYEGCKRWESLILLISFHNCYKAYVNAVCKRPYFGVVCTPRVSLGINLLYILWHRLPSCISAKKLWNGGDYYHLHEIVQFSDLKNQPPYFLIRGEGATEWNFLSTYVVQGKLVKDCKKCLKVRGLRYIMKRVAITRIQKKFLNLMNINRENWKKNILDIKSWHFHGEIWHLQSCN